MGKFVIKAETDKLFLCLQFVCAIDFFKIPGKGLLFRRCLFWALIDYSVRPKAK